MSRLLPVAFNRDSSPASRQPLPGMEAGSGTGAHAHTPRGHPRRVTRSVGIRGSRMPKTHSRSRCVMN